MGIIVGLAVLGILGSTMLLAAIWVFRPLDQAAKGRKFPAQFMLADFFCLFFLVQLGMTPLIIKEKTAWILVGYTTGGLFLAWFFGQQTLSRAGIQNGWDRILFEALVIPGALCCMVALPGVIVYGYVSWFDPFNQNIRDATASFLGLIGLIALLYVFGRLTRWLVSKAGHDPSPPSTQ